MIIPCQRDQFDIPQDVAYLNCSFMAPLMKSILNAGISGLQKKAEPWKIKPEDFFDQAESARKLFAALINTGADQIALIPACSYGIAVAARNIPFAKGDEIIVLDEQFPSNVYSWRELAQEKSGVLTTVKRAGEQSWTESILSAMNAATRIVAIPNVHWTDGSLIELAAIRQKCDEIDAELVLDLTQSLGAHSFDVNTIKPAFMACSAYKWLLGPYSMGFLYISPKYQNAMPLEHNWINRKGSADFSDLVHYQDDFQVGGRKFDVGERSNFVLLPMTIVALQQILDWGIANISETIAQMTEQLCSELSETNIIIPAAPQRAPHILGLRFPNGLPNDLLQRLADNKVYVSVRSDAVRISPHVYNTKDDLQKLTNLLKTFNRT